MYLMGSLFNLSVYLVGIGYLDVPGGEFAQPVCLSGGYLLFRRTWWGVCSTCLSIWWVFLLVTCMVAIGSLFYLHFKLKNEAYQLQQTLNKGSTRFGGRRGGSTFLSWFIKTVCTLMCAKINLTLC